MSMGAEPTSNRMNPLPLEGNAAAPSPEPPESLFERFGWLYAFFREHPVPRRHGRHRGGALAPGRAAAGQPVARTRVRSGFLLLPVRRTLPAARRAGHRPLPTTAPPRAPQRPDPAAGKRALRAGQRARPRAAQRDRRCPALCAVVHDPARARARAGGDAPRDARGGPLFHRGAEFAAADGDPAGNHVGAGESHDAGRGLPVARLPRAAKRDGAAAGRVRGAGALAAVAQRVALAGRALSVRHLRERPGGPSGGGERKGARRTP